MELVGIFTRRDPLARAVAEHGDLPAVENVLRDEVVRVSEVHMQLLPLASRRGLYQGSNPDFRNQNPVSCQLDEREMGYTRIKRWCGHFVRTVSALLS